MAPNADLKVTLLGQPRAWRGDTPLKLGRGLQTAVFVALALRANRVVSRAELISALWGDAPPSGASGKIYTYISALRRVVEGDEDGSPDVVESGRSGYRLLIAADNLDFTLLQRYRDQARALRARGDSRGELDFLDKALAMWDGEALRSVPGPFALSWRQRMAEANVVLRARRACLLIDMGQHDEVIDELRDLASRYPAREDIYHSLMLALSRSGRQLEALAVYRQAREMLIERFGTEPGAALRALRQAVLTSGAGAPRSPEPVARAGVAADEPATGACARIAEGRPVTFVGRREQVARIRAAVAAVKAGRGGALWVSGAAGTGKTALICEGLAGLASEEGVLGWGAADELSCRNPLSVLEGCVGGLDGALLRRAGLAVRNPVPDGAAHGADNRLQVGSVIPQVRALLESAGRRPLVLVLDDLHWADDETLLVWRHLHTMTSSYPVLLISACRPLPRRRNLDLLHMLVAESGCETVELGDLSSSEVRELLQAVHPTDRHTADFVATMSGGSPAFVRAIGKAVAARRTRNWLSTPDSVAKVVLGYLECFSPGTRDMLRCAALLGYSHSVGSVLKASGKRAYDLLNVVDEALAGGVLVDLGGSRLRFRHPIVRRVLYESIPVAMRRATLDDVGVDTSTTLSTYWSSPAETHDSMRAGRSMHLVTSESDDVTAAGFDR